jgi:hypothetical protein
VEKSAKNDVEKVERPVFEATGSGIENAEKKRSEPAPTATGI